MTGFPKLGLWPSLNLTVLNYPRAKRARKLETTMYYLDKKPEAISLSKLMLADGWSVQDVQCYWDKLGYDIWFVDTVVSAAKEPTL